MLIYSLVDSLLTITARSFFIRNSRTNTITSIYTRIVITRSFNRSFNDSYNPIYFDNAYTYLDYANIYTAASSPSYPSFRTNNYYPVFDIFNTRKTSNSI